MRTNKSDHPSLLEVQRIHLKSLGTVKEYVSLWGSLGTFLFELEVLIIIVPCQTRLRVGLNLRSHVIVVKLGCHRG